MKKLIFFPRFLALWLILSLALPNPAFALRQLNAGAEENQPLTNELRARFLDSTSNPSEPVRRAAAGEEEKLDLAVKFDQLQATIQQDIERLLAEQEKGWKVFNLDSALKQIKPGTAEGTWFKIPDTVLVRVTLKSGETFLGGEARFTVVRGGVRFDLFQFPTVAMVGDLFSPIFSDLVSSPSRKIASISIQPPSPEQVAEQKKIEAKSAKKILLVKAESALSFLGLYKQVYTELSAEEPGLAIQLPAPDFGEVERLLQDENPDLERARALLRQRFTQLKEVEYQPPPITGSHERSFWKRVIGVASEAQKQQVDVILKEMTFNIRKSLLVELLGRAHDGLLSGLEEKSTPEAGREALVEEVSIVDFVGSGKYAAGVPEGQRVLAKTLLDNGAVTIAAGVVGDVFQLVTDSDLTAAANMNLNRSPIEGVHFMVSGELRTEQNFQGQGLIVPSSAQGSFNRPGISLRILDPVSEQQMRALTPLAWIALNLDRNLTVNQVLSLRLSFLTSRDEQGRTIYAVFA